jgi:CBS domain-containing protein
MYAKDYVREDPVYVVADDTLSTAIDKMIDSHQLNLWVVDEEGRFVGEIRALQFAKILAPATVGSHYEIESEISAEESVAESLEDAKKRLEPYRDRKVKDFVDHDIPVARPDMPIATALMLLRGGLERVPVVEAASKKLLGTLSMLTVLSRIRR